MVPALHKLANDGSLVSLQDLLNDPTLDLNVKNDDGDNALLFAIRHEQLEAVKVLLKDPRVDLNERGKHGETGLHAASRYRLIAGQNNKACRILKVLLAQQNVPVNATEKNSQTALGIALATGNQLAAKFLSQDPRLDCDLRDEENRNILHIAADSKCTNLAIFLAQSTKFSHLINTKDQLGRTMLHYAVANELALDLVHELIAQPDKVNVNEADNEGETPLHYAAKSDSQTMLHCLTANPTVNVNAVNSNGQTPLHVITNKWNNQSLIATLLKREDVDFSIRDYNGQLAATIPAVRDDLHSVVALIRAVRGDEFLLKGKHVTFTSVKKKSDKDVKMVQLLLTSNRVKQKLISSSLMRVNQYLSTEWRYRDKRNVLYCAVDIGDRRLLEHFLQICDTHQFSRAEEMIQRACDRRWVEGLELLLEKTPKDKLRAKCQRCLGVLGQWACNNENNLFEEASLRGCQRTMKFFLENYEWPGTAKDTFVNSRVGIRPTLLHYACQGGSKEILELVLTHFPCIEIDQQDYDGNTALHIAAGKSLELIVVLIMNGANCSQKNRSRKTFLQMSFSVKDSLINYLSGAEESVFKQIMASKSIINNILELGDDDLLLVLLKKICSITSVSSPNGEDQMKSINHPTSLLPKVWEKRSGMPLSLKYVLTWEAIAHKYRKDEIEKCCYETLPKHARLQVYNYITAMLPQKVQVGMYFSNLGDKFFIVSLLIAFIDVVSDITLTAEYAMSWDDILQDYPNTTVCSIEKTIGCQILQVPHMVPFLYSLTVLIIPLFVQLFLVLLRSSAKTFLAISSGYCCWLKAAQHPNSVTCTTIILFWLQPFITHVYEFIITVFVKAQRDNHAKILPSYGLAKTFSVTQGIFCGRCKDCSSTGSQCLCISCGKNANDLRHLRLLEENAFFLHSKSKIITASTENSFMPLLQFTFLFPQVVRLFPKNHYSLSEVGSVLKSLAYNWQFVVTAASISLSILSMAGAFTVIYFSKEGKQEQRTVVGWSVYCIAIILQVLTRLLSFQAFGFGYMVAYLGPNAGYMSLGMAGIALVHNVAASCYHHYWRHRENQKQAVQDTVVDSICNGFASLYVMTEFSLIERTKSPQQQAVRVENTPRKTFWKHVIFDFAVFTENVLLASGASYISDKNFSLSAFWGTLLIIQLLGYTMKAGYYLFFHPWIDLNDQKEKLHVLFLILVGMTALPTVVLSWHYVPSVRTTLLVLGSMLFLFSCIYFKVRTAYCNHHKYNNDIIKSFSTGMSRSLCAMETSMYETNATSNESSVRITRKKSYAPTSINSKQ